MTYLDNTATSYPKPHGVAEAMLAAMENAGNPGRASHALARRASQILSETRSQIARLIGCNDPSRIVLTSGCTDSLNIAIKGVLQKGDHVITTRLEHNSVLRPLRRLEQDGIISLSLIGFDNRGYIDPLEVSTAIRQKTRMIAVTAASNVLGSLQPVDEIASIASAHSIVLLVDAAQTLGVLDLPLDGIGLLAGGGHKGLLGPEGTGFLYVSPALKLKHWREGGTGGDSVSPLHPEEMPVRLEAGTPNVPGFAGLKAGIDYVLERGTAQILRHELELTERLLEGLSTIPAITVYGSRNRERRIATVAFSLQGYSSDEVATILDESFQIAVRGGLHCAPLLHKALGTDGLVRVGLGPFNTAQDVDRLLEALAEIASA